MCAATSNLRGVVGDLPTGRDAFQQALRITSGDPKLHNNLADVPDDMNLPLQAFEHWRAFLHLERSDSPWLEYARTKMGSPVQ